MIRIHGKLFLSNVDGPGERVVVHFQGCSRKCPGCFNPKTHSKIGGREVFARDLAHELLSMSPRVTISGGEPLEQPSGLYSLLLELRARGCEDIVLYTGCTWREACAKKDSRIFAQHRMTWKYPVDTVIAGPYEQDKPEPVRMCGSTNQQIIHLTGRHKPEDFENHEVEVQMDEDGNVVIAGFPDLEFLDAIAAEMAEGGN